NVPFPAAAPTATRPLSLHDALPISESGAAKTTVTVAVLDDASRESVLWALKNGKVTSDTVEVQVDMLPFAAIMEAFGSQAYDVVEASPVAVPRALQGGLELLIFSPGLFNFAGTGLYVGADSGIRSEEHTSEL